MNPIEHVWDALGRRVAGRQPPPQTLHELERALLEEWDRIPQLVINSLIDSMPQRYSNKFHIKFKFTMDFEDILKDVGGFGVYQKVLVAVFLIPTFIVIPWFSMNSIFLNNSPDHWCNVPEVVNSNLSFETQQYLIRPVEDRYCRMYDIDYSELLHSGNFSIDQSWPTRECDQGWTFDRTNYDATSVTKWNMVCHDGHFSSLVLSLIFIGDVIGTPLYGFLSDNRVGRNQTTVMRICDRWMQEGTTDRRGRSHPPQCTSSREDRQLVLMTVTDRSVTSLTVAQHIESVMHPSVFARTIRRRLQQSGLSARRP
ncbi:carcinine transporter [Trichonephila clavipes]|nr:carcinine transporter [Trichonephila clavipes]